jgi:cell division protein FtsB
MEEQFSSPNRRSESGRESERESGRESGREPGRATGRNYVNRAQFQQAEIVPPNDTSPSNTRQTAQQQRSQQNAERGRASTRPASRDAHQSSSQASSSQAQRGRRPRISAAQLLLLRRWLVLSGLAVGALCVVFFVNNVLHVGKLTEEIERLKKEQDRLLQQNELFRAEIIRLQAPDRITKIARTKLNMVSASSAPQRIRAANED